MANGYVSAYVQIKDVKTVEDFRKYCKSTGMNSSAAITKIVRYYLENKEV